MKRKSVKVRIGEVILLTPNIVLCKRADDHSITFDDAKEMIDLSCQLTGERDFAVILDGGPLLDVDERSMNYASKFDEKRWKAFAIIVRTITERLFANYYLVFKKPGRPTKIFTSQKEAEKWLAEILKDEVKLDYKL